MNRREFLRVAAGGVVLFFQAACQAAFPSSSAPRPSPTNALAETSPPAPTPDPNLAQSKLALPLPLEQTPIEKFYVTSYSDTIPGFNPNLWSFALDGLVTRPLKFTFDELRALPVVQVTRTLECIGNPIGGSLIGNATWKGVSLKELLKKAEVKPTAKYLIMDGADEYFTSVPFDLALTDEALLVYEMNDQPLAPEHGRPARVLLPGVYGQKQPKWITHIQVTDHYEQGFWEKKGWSDTAIIRPNTRMDRPLDGNTLTGKPGDVFTIAGIAFTSTPGVARVEVSADDGATWHDATLTRAPAPFTNFVWTRWGYDWQLPASGKSVLLARVTDNAGNGQGASSARFFQNAFPSGADAIPIAVVQVKTD